MSRHVALHAWPTVDVREDGDTTTITLTSAEGRVSSLVIAGDADADLALDAPSPSGLVATSLTIEPGSPEPKE
jgi:hypothetical protein